jgi:hypothetical protein
MVFDFDITFFWHSPRLLFSMLCSKVILARTKEGQYLNNEYRNKIIQKQRLRIIECDQLLRNTNNNAIARKKSVKHGIHFPELSG